MTQKSETDSVIFIFISGCESEADVVFVVDTSRYIPQRLLKQVKRMLRRTIKRLSFKSKNMRVGLVSFDEQARVRLYLGNGDRKRNVLAAISSLRCRPES